MTESEVLILKVLKAKHERHGDIYFPSKQIGEDEVFQNRSTPTYRPTMSAGAVLGNLYKKGLVDVAVSIEGPSSIIRFYKISEQGKKEIKSRNQELIAQYKTLENNCKFHLKKLEEFKEVNGI